MHVKICMEEEDKSEALCLPVPVGSVLSNHLFWRNKHGQQSDACTQAFQAKFLRFFSLVFNVFFFSSFYLQIFPGNSDNNVHKKNVLDPPFYARFVRVIPWEWHGRITLRMELLGCED